ENHHQLEQRERTAMDSRTGLACDRRHGPTSNAGRWHRTDDGEQLGAPEKLYGTRGQTPSTYTRPPGGPDRMRQISALLGATAPMIDVVDVGALWLGEESVAYRPLIGAGLARVVGFEPAPGECERLNSMGLPNHRFLPYFIGDGTRRKFHLCNYP